VNNHQLILAFVRDLNFAVRIESAAQKNGFQVKVIESADQIAPPDKKELKVQYAEHLEGRGAVLLDKITQWHPVLIIFDLGNDLIPWEDWINLISSVPATHRLPILCFGPHVDVDMMQAAKLAGAKEVVARSRFVTQLPNLLLKFAKNTDSAEMEELCREHLSYFAKRGLEKFNSRALPGHLAGCGGLLPGSARELQRGCKDVPALAPMDRSFTGFLPWS
jgi:hypothetical protein